MCETAVTRKYRVYRKKKKKDSMILYKKDDNFQVI